MQTLRTCCWILSIAILALVGCKKDDDNAQPEQTTNTTPAQCDLTVTFWFRNGFSPYQLSDIFEDAGANLVRFNKVRLLFSNFRQLDDAGNVVTAFPNVVVLADMANGANGTYHLGTVPAGEVRRLAFDIGLDPTTNAMAPSQFSGPPLSDPTLFINNTLGHRFVTFEGHVNADGNLSLTDDDQVVTYQAATDAALRHDEVTANLLAVAGNGPVNVIVPIQLMNILNGINLVNTPSSIGAGAPIVQLMSNVQAAVGG